MKNPVRFTICFLALSIVLSGCSSSQTSSDSAEVDSSSQSGADAVGSIPEDMLADESSPESAPSEEAAAPAGDDPFQDLATEAKEQEEIANAMTVTEDNGGAAAATSGDTAEYEVKAGDTLMKIAFHIYGDIDRWKDLQAWNEGRIKNINQLRAGTKLKYETPLEPFQQEQLGHSYTIKKGDTLALIADEVYGRKMKYKKLQKYNAKLIKNPNRIFAGFTIYYDITPQEMAEAEARRQERMAGGGHSAPANQNAGDDVQSLIPSAINPPAEAQPPSPPPVAAAPQVPAPASTTAPNVPPPPAN